MTEFRVWAGGGYELAEGTRWLGDRLVFTDILAGALLAAPGEALGDVRALARLDVPLGAVAPVAGRPGEWIAARLSTIFGPAFNYTVPLAGEFCWLSLAAGRSRPNS